MAPVPVPGLMGNVHGKEIRGKVQIQLLSDVRKPERPGAQQKESSEKAAGRMWELPAVVWKLGMERLAAGAGR